MSLLARLSERSWERPGGGHPEPESYRPPAAKVVLVLYFAVAAMLFGLCGAAYLMRIGLPVMAHGPLCTPLRLPDPRLLWLDTGVLGLASLAWEFAWSRVRRGRPATDALIAAGLLGVLFVAGQLAIWRQLVATGHGAREDPAAAFFYLITALHGLHVFGGLWFWARVTTLLRAGRGTVQAVQLTATYWHFLLFVWVLMVALFVST